MSIQSITQAATAFATGLVGETVEYKPYPAEAFVEISAHIERQPVDAFGSFLQNVIRVWIDTGTIGRPYIGKDQIRLAQLDPGDTQAVYTVTADLSKHTNKGGYWLEATL